MFVIITFNSVHLSLFLEMSPPPPPPPPPRLKMPFGQQNVIKEDNIQLKT